MSPMRQPDRPRRPRQSAPAPTSNGQAPIGAPVAERLPPVLVEPSDRPLSETTLAELAELAARYPVAQSALLPMLHLVQSSEGYVTPAGIEACAEILDLTAAEVSAVATFYTMYKRRPIGDYHVGVCTNTLCAVMGGDAIFERLKDHLDVGNDETTPDGVITLEHVECNAACDYAPVVMVNWEFFDNQTPASATDLVDELRAGREITSTRGARVCTWREAERVLAGFPDGRADEGPVGGPATLVGLELARANRWQAPGGERDGGDAAGGEAAGSGRKTGSGQDTDSTGEAVGNTSTMQAAKTAETHRAESETVADQDTPAGGPADPASPINGKGDATP